MGLIKFVGSTMLVVLFAIALISFVTQFGDDNDAAIKLSDDTRLDNSDFTSEADSYSLVVNSSGSVFEEMTIESELVTPVEPLSMYKVVVV